MGNLEDMNVEGIGFWYNRGGEGSKWDYRRVD